MTAFQYDGSDFVHDFFRVEDYSLDYLYIKPNSEEPCIDHHSRVIYLY